MKSMWRILLKSYRCSSPLNTQIDVGNTNEMLLFGIIIINNVTLVENAGCQYGSKKLKRNCMEVYIKLYLAAREVNSIFLFCMVC